MKKPELLKQILAGSLVLTLALADVTPVAAAKVQQPQEAVEAESEYVELDEAIQAEPQEAVAAEPEAEAAGTEADGSDEAEADNEEPQAEEEEIKGESLEAEEDVRAAVTPVISQPTIRVSEYSSYSNFYVSYSGSNCEAVELSVKASNTGSIVYSSSYYESGDGIDSDNFYDSKTGSYDLVAGVTYTFTLKPFTYTYDEDDNEVKVYGAQASVTWKAPAIAKVQSLAVKEQTSSGFVLSHKAISGNPRVYYEYSKDKKFKQDVNTLYSYSGGTDTLSYSSLTPGITYYVRAYMMRYGAKGAYSNVITVKAPVAEVTNISTEIFDKAVTLKASTGYGQFTGYQIERKSGKKYKKLATTTDSVYKDTGLKKNTKYTYRVRAYYYNINTKKYAYGAYTYKTVQTGTAALNMRAKAISKSSAKLTWKKLSLAAGYDVYRYTGFSSSSTEKSGEDYDFNKYELVKSLGKKSSSYTDKKLVAGESYNYLLMAYKTVNGKKVYFAQDSDSISTNFSFNTYISIYKQAQNPKNGKVSIAWKPVPQAKGYLVEKYDDAKEKWVTQKKITKAKTTSYTLPAAPLGKTVRYRLRAYNGKRYSYSSEVSVTGRIKVVTGVKAKATKEGVSISWKKVSGASYYKVFRTTSSEATYNADTKSYYYDGYDSTVSLKAFKKSTSSASDYYYTVGSSSTHMVQDYEAAQKKAYKDPEYNQAYTDCIVGTSVVDYSYAAHEVTQRVNGKVTKENVTLYGPQSDVTYHYYVVAYKKAKDKTTNSYYTGQSYGASKSASATMASAAGKAPTIQKTKAGKQSATITVKKVKGAKKYLIYRSTSKKKGFKLVGSSSKSSYKDKKLTSNKTYYYKVKVLFTNNLGADKYSSFSKVKSVKAK